MRIVRLVLFLLCTFVAFEYFLGETLNVTILHTYVYTTANKYNKSALETKILLCEENSTNFGPITPDRHAVSMEELKVKFPQLKLGGQFSPSDCLPRHKVAIIIPYRDREDHLSIFLNNIHPFLMAQNLEYGIFIIEQVGSLPFNRAKLMNVGFVESVRLKEGGWQCFIFHDIDLIPIDSRNIYNCPKNPRHMSVAVDKFHFRLPYQQIFGGVTALTLDQFESVNGFSNEFWGWGGEDDDLFNRLKTKGLSIERYDKSISRYVMLNHTQAKGNPKRYTLLRRPTEIHNKDGLSSLEYSIVEIRSYELFTHILVDIDVFMKTSTTMTSTTDRNQTIQQVEEQNALNITTTEKGSK